MIDLSHKFALLETGEIEPLFYEDGDPRQAYEEDGKFYLDHDEYICLGDSFMLAYMHHEIIATSDREEELYDPNSSNPSEVS